MRGLVSRMQITIPALLLMMHHESFWHTGHRLAFVVLIQSVIE